MIRTAVRLSSFVLPSFLKSRNEFDCDTINQPQVGAPQTGWERVKMMYRMNEYDEPSVELHNIAQATFSGCFVGAAIGGFFRSRGAYMYFIENNQATIFKSPMQAKKRLQDHVTVAFAKGAYQWGWRLGIFTGIFSTIVTTVSVYNGTTSLIDYTVAGTITGAMYKANLGLAATLVGAGLGATLSTIGGIIILGILSVAGVSMDDIRKALYKIKESRKEQMKQAEAKSFETKEDTMIKHHESVVHNKGEARVEQL